MKIMEIHENAWESMTIRCRDVKDRGGHVFGGERAPVGRGMSSLERVWGSSGPSRGGPGQGSGVGWNFISHGKDLFFEFRKNPDLLIPGPRREKILTR